MQPNEIRSLELSPQQRESNPTALTPYPSTTDHHRSSNRPPRLVVSPPNQLPPVQLLDCGDVLPVYATQDRRSNCSSSSHGRWRPSILSRARPMISLSPLPEEGGMKECCSRESCILCMITVTTFRWVLLFFALVGIGCIVSGVILGAMHTIVGNSFLTLSIMFIGLGVLLVIVIGIGYRCTPPGHEPCHVLFNLGDNWMHPSGATGSYAHRMRHRATDRNQWLGGVIYPEFEYRIPPPSYNESLQEYHQIALAQQRCAVSNSQAHPPQTPPPSYISQTGTIYAPATAGGRSDRRHGNSRPPSYRTHDNRRRPRFASPECAVTNASIRVQVEADISVRSATDTYVSLEPNPDDRFDNVDNPFYLDDIISLDATLASFSSMPDGGETVDERVAGNITQATNQNEDCEYDKARHEVNIRIPDNKNADNNTDIEKVRVSMHDITGTILEALYDANGGEICDMHVENEKSVETSARESDKGAFGSTTDVSVPNDCVEQFDANCSAELQSSDLRDEDANSVKSDGLEVSSFASLDEDTTL